MQAQENTIIREIRNPEVPPKASEQLRLTCKKIKKFGASQKLFSNWPNLRTASYNLVEFLTIYWPDPLDRNESLLAACLENAFQVTESLYKEKVDHVEIQKAFIKTVTDELAVSMEYSLMIRSKTLLVHHEVNQEFLSELIRENTVHSLTWTKGILERRSGQHKVICASRVFTLNELELAGLID
jgi:hypothetical protein